MTPSEWWATVPDEPGPEQDTAVLDAHRLGLVAHEWAPLDLGLGLVVAVSRCAARIGSGRPRYTWATQRQAGALLGGLLLTPALVDAIWRQAAVRLYPHPLGDGKGGPAPDMARVSAWRRHDAIGSTWGPDGALVASEGKDWVQAPSDGQHPGRVANYGWHRTDGRVWQPLGYAHDWRHTDYSQLGRWASRAASLNGEPVQLLDVMRGQYGGELERLVGGPVG